MHVELGNVAPLAEGANAPAVTTMDIPDTYTYVVADAGVAMKVARGHEPMVVETAADLAAHVLRDIMVGDPRITHSPDQEAVISVFNAWANESSRPPAWVACDVPEFETLLGHLFGCPTGRPDDVEATHYTRSGPPGVGPEVTE